MGKWAVAVDRHESGGGGPLIHSSGGHRGSPVKFGHHNWTLTKVTTMTDEMMTLRSLLEKNADADVLREMIGLPPNG